MGKKSKSDAVACEDPAPNSTKVKEEKKKVEKKRAAEQELVAPAGHKAEKKKRKGEPPLPEEPAIKPAQKEKKKKKKEGKFEIVVKGVDQPAGAGSTDSKKNKAKGSDKGSDLPTTVTEQVKPKKTKKKDKSDLQDGCEAAAPSSTAAPVDMAVEVDASMVTKKTKKKKTKQAEDVAPNAGSNGTLSKEQDGLTLTGNVEAEVDKRKHKKRKTDGSRDTTETATQPAVDAAQQRTTTGSAPNEKHSTTPLASNGTGSAGKAFQRVKAEEWLGKLGAVTLPEEYTKSQSGGWAKAQQTLDSVRGRDFRREKTKMKRTNFRNGAIDATARFSYKFDSDNE